MFKAVPIVDAQSRSFELQDALTQLGYEFPHGCFATDKNFNFRWRIAHYPTVLNRIQKDFSLRLVSQSPRIDLVDPGPPFQKAFDQVDRIEFVISGRGRFGSVNKVVEVADWEDVRRLFEILEFVPFDKGSGYHCNCGGDEKVRAFSDDTLVGEFTIHHGTAVRWEPLETDVLLIPNSIGALEAYFDQQVYGRQESKKIPERYSPLMPLTPMEMPANTHIDTDKAEQAGADQPATKPADKHPVKGEPSTPTLKDRPR